MAAGGPGGRILNFITIFSTQGHQQTTAAIRTYQQAAAGVQKQNVYAARSFDLLRFAKYAVGWTLIYRSLNFVIEQTTSLVTETIKLDEALRNVNVIAGLSEDELAKVRDRLIEMSTSAEGGLQPVQDLAQALYQINSAGIIGAESLKVLEASSRAAMAGLSDSETAAKALISVLNAYGFSANQAAHVSDVLFQTVKIGVPRFEDLATNISLTATVSAALGVSVEEMGLAWGALSRNMTDAAKTNVALSQLMISFLKPSEQMRNAIRQLGFENGQAMIKQLGFIGALKALYSLAGMDATVWAGLVQNRRALQAALAFLREDFKLSTDANIEYGKSLEGATARAQTEQLKSSAAQVKKLKNEWTALKLELGQEVIPTWGRLLDTLTEVLRRIRQLGSALREDAVQPFNQTSLGGILFGIISPEGYTKALQQELERRAKSLAGQSGAPIRGLSLKIGDLPLPVARPTEKPAGARGESFEELMRQFKNAQARAAGEFRTSELAAIGTTLLPAAYREMEEANKRLLDLEKERADAIGDVKAETEDIAKINDNIADALKEVQQLEEDIANLEGRRVEIAKDLVSEARKLGEAYQKALEAFADVNLARAAEAVQSIQRGFEMQLDPLRQFRDLMEDALDPDRARRLREEIQRLTLAEINAEIEQLQRNLLWLEQNAKADPTGQRRIAAGQQIISAVQRRAGLQAQFGTENIQAEFSAQQKALQDRIVRMQTALGKEADPFGPRTQFFQAQIKAARDELKRMGERPEITAEQIAKPYIDAFKQIEGEQAKINALLDKQVENQGKVAEAAKQAILDFGTALTQIPWAGWGQEAGIAWREGFNKGLYPGQGAPGYDPKGTPKAGSRQSGGPIARTGPFLLHQGEHVLPKWLVDRFGGSQQIMRLLASLDFSGPRTTPERRPIDWLAHGFGRLADWARGHRVSITAIEREEAYLRRTLPRRAQGTVGMIDLPSSSSRGGGGTTINLNGVDLTSLVSESTKRELVAAVMGIAGDRGVQGERRRGTAAEVA